MGIEELQYLVNGGDCDLDPVTESPIAPPTTICVSFEQRVHMDTIATIRNGISSFRWRIPNDINIQVFLLKIKFWKFDRKVVYTVESVGVLQYLKVCIRY